MSIRLLAVVTLWLCVGFLMWITQFTMVIAALLGFVGVAATAGIFLAQSDGPLTEAQKNRRKEAEEKAKASRLAKAKAKADKELKKEAAKAQKAAAKGKDVPSGPKVAKAKEKSAAKK